MKQILLLEDDESLGATLSECLQKEGYTVEWLRSIREAKDASQGSPFDVAIIDLNLPDGSGFELAESLRSKNPPVPFLFLTAMATAEYRLQGYEIGAEEYIPKPFHLKELLLRVRHVLDNHSILREYKLGSTSINFEKMCVTNASGKTEYLTAKDCQVLRILVESSPEVVSRDKILENVWGSDKFPTNRTVDNSILRLRQVLGDNNSDYIRTVRGIGYQILKEGK